MACADDWPSGSSEKSKERNQVSPLASFAVKPGEKPAPFSRISTHRSVLGGGPTLGPRTISSTDGVRARIRFVNQPESGTSSMVLTFRAWTFDGTSCAVTNRWYDKSYRSPTSSGRAPDASRLSGSRASGSSARNRGVDAGTSATADRVSTNASRTRPVMNGRKERIIGVSQNAAWPENTNESASLLFASSMRSGVAAGPWKRKPRP